VVNGQSQFDRQGRDWGILVGDVLDRLADLPDGSVQCVVTSPPYWGLRDYGVDGQIGLEETPREFVAKIVRVFHEVRRVLRDDGTLWMNLGDSYAHSGACGLKPKDLTGIPWRVAFALREAGWYLRQDIIWAKKSPMPESARDRCTKAHDYIFLLSKSPRYYFDQIAIREPGTNQAPGNKKSKYLDAYNAGDQFHRTKVGQVNYGPVEFRKKRDVWTIGAEPYSEAHFATFPSAIPITCIKAGTSEAGACPTCGTPWERVTEKNVTGNHCGNAVAGVSAKPLGWQPACDHGHSRDELYPCVVLDPFLGSGTTVRAAIGLRRIGWGIELNPEYAELAVKRILKPREPFKRIEPLPGQKSLFEATAP